MKQLMLFFLYITVCSHAAAQNILLADTTRPFVLGTTVTVRSQILGENRVLNIYLPEGYKTDTARYPVIYLLDGSADEDFIHVVGLVQFCSFDWVKRLPRCIVVGIANVNRLRDFTYHTTLKEDKEKYPASGHSDAFIRFLEKELQPFIDHSYRTNNSSTLIGESLGGLLATEIVLKKPALFNNYIIISPSLWWDNGSLLAQTPVHDANKTKTGIYIGVGKEGLTPGKQPRVMEVDANVLADKLQSLTNTSVFFDYLPQENHATIAHLAIYNAFKVLYK